MLSVPMKSVYEMNLDDCDMDGGKFDRDPLKKRGQNRGLDGKFESSLKDLDDDFSDIDMQESNFGGAKKQSTRGQIKMNKTNKELFDVAPPTRKRKGRGAVANVFYDSQ